MSFVGRARSSFERGDTLRAVLTLVAGLRRSPNHSEALTLLVELVRDEVESGGIEHEIAQVLQPQSRRNQLLSEMVIGLRDREQDRIADRLVLEAERRGMAFIPPPEPEPAPEPEPELEADETGDADEESDESALAVDPDSDDESDEEEASATTSEERDRRQREAAAAEARLSERKREAIAQRQAEVSAKRRRRTVQIVVLALIVGIGFVGVYVAGAASRSADLTKLETAIHRFNRFDNEDLAAVSEAASTRSEPEFAERLAFAHALSGEPTTAGLDDWETSWGFAAGVVSALQKNDVENALALVTKAERTDEGSLGAEFARAILEEHRGNSDEARAAATRVIDRYAQFAPAHEVIVRTSARQLELDTMQAAVEQLRSIAPKHPYTTLGSLPHVRDVLLGPTPNVEEPASLQTKDPFLRACQAYQRSVAAAARGDQVAVVAHANSALAADPGMLPARVLMATAQVNAGELEPAVSEFERAAKDARSAQVRLLIQASAPFALTGAGRPDLAARFTTPYPKLRATGVDDRFDEKIGDARPEPLRTSALSDLGMIPWAAEALYARAYLRGEAGESAAASAMYSDLISRNIAPGRAEAMLETLHSPTSGDSAMVRIVGRYNDGYFEHEVWRDWQPEPWAVPLSTSIRARSALALDRVGTALRILESANIALAHVAQIDAVRFLAAGRLGRKNELFANLSMRYQLDEVRAVTTSLLVAEALFWQRQFTNAEKWLEHAQKLGALSFDTTWVCALVSMGRNKPDELAACLDGSNADSVGPYKAALGFVQLELGRQREAIEHFEAVLKFAPSTDSAARGLGEALVDRDGRGAKNSIDRARRDLEGRARAELDRWYAVAAGLRKGEEEALEPLDAATKVLGERADLLAERARYHAAREEWGPAEQLYVSALRLDDTLADAHLAVARIKLRGDDQDEARKHLKRFLELNPQSASAAWARQQLE